MRQVMLSLLAPKPLYFTSPRSQAPEWLMRFPPLIKERFNAFRHVKQFNDAPADKLIMVQGPPGPGKTRVIRNGSLHDGDSLIAVIFEDATDRF